MRNRSLFYDINKHNAKADIRPLIDMIIYGAVRIAYRRAQPKRSSLGTVTKVPLSTEEV